MENKDWKTLLAGYLEETLGPAEIDALLNTLAETEFKTQWHQAIEEILADKVLHGLSGTDERQKILQAILDARETPVNPWVVAPVRGFVRRWRKLAAIVFIVVLAAGAYLKLHLRAQLHSPVAAVSRRFKNDLPAGGDKAVLTLGNGRKIILDSASNGTLAREGNMSVRKSARGEITYTAISVAKPAATQYNTINTPPGGQYHLTLSDGTHVWLDAATSLRYPVQFDGMDRSVELSGQAYFEVSANEEHPFLVSVNQAAIRVLGTRFNIEAYNDEESSKTTLLEGRIKIGKGEQTLLLRPGQQAQWRTKEIIHVVDNADLAEVMAWKNGVFLLKAAGIHAIMRQVARWYNVRVDYKGGDIDQTFYGTIPRSVSAVSLFKVLEETGGVHFSIDGSKVIVSP